MKISQAVLEVLDRAEVDGNRLVLTGQLDRSLYQHTNKVLEAIGGKWNRNVKAHLFDGPVIDVLDPILETGEYSRAKQDFGQFDTPPEVVARIIELAELRPGMWIYEPSAGLGNIVAGVIEALGSGASIWGHEIDPKRHAKCVTRNYRAFGGGGLGLGDFLEVEPGDEPGFDRVLMNPPFAGQADIVHVLHAMRFLKPGGRLVSVMSSGVIFRANKRAVDFREFASKHGGVFERLPDNAFSASGTSVNACIITLTA